MVNCEILRIVAIAFASFSLGFSMCNTLWTFDLPKKRKDRHGKAPDTDETRDN